MSAVDACKAVIFGCAGEALSAREAEFFRAHRPFGFILFARNCVDPSQLAALTASLRALSGRGDVPILIDQEGGRVARLKPPHWRAAPAAARFDALARRDGQSAQEAVYLNARLIAAELHALGITVDCAPMIDVRAPGSHDIIGDRALGDDPAQVAVLGGAMARGLMEGGVLPVIKHIPGHGRARVDSHEDLPVVDASLEVLRAVDFAPFKALCHLPFAMTAHIRYTAIDDEVATLSPKVIRLIREEIGFDGALMSDDISMKALQGDLAQLARQTIAAGCDLVLHCNGAMEEMEAIAAHTPLLAGDALRRAHAACALLQAPLAFDNAAALARFETLLA